MSTSCLNVLLSVKKLCELSIQLQRIIQDTISFLPIQYLLKENTFSFSMTKTQFSCLQGTSIEVRMMKLKVNIDKAEQDNTTRLAELHYTFR